MNLKGKKLLVCNCEVSMALDGKALAKACGAEGGGQVHTQLCRAQIESFRAALAEGRPVLVGCTQETPLFEETRAEVAPEVTAAYVNIRERAGWAADGAKALPKMAALLAEATLDLASTPSVTMASEGRCLVYGRDEVAIKAAQQLASRLSVTLLLTQPGDVIPPRLVDLPIFQGTVRSVSGHLGAFQLEIDDHAPMTVSSRQALGFEPARSGVTTQCDLILDLSGEAPLVPAHAKRDGYFKPEPGNPAAVQRALFDLTDLVGEFEKPRYVDFDAELCAHSQEASGPVAPAALMSARPPRSSRTAMWSRSIPYLCGGCGACNSVCPTGAAGYAYPPNTALLERLRTLLGTYRDAGGVEPVSANP